MAGYSKRLPTATTGAPGLVPLASDTETQGGAVGNKAVTPAALHKRTATETRAGIVELATVAETRAGTDTQRAVTPAGLAAVGYEAGKKKLVWSGGTNAGVNLNSVSGGHPGEGFYLVETNSNIVLVHVVIGKHTENGFGQGSIVQVDASGVLKVLTPTTGAPTLWNIKNIWKVGQQ